MPTTFSRQKTAVMFVVVTALLAVYFTAAGLYFPQLYLSLEQHYPAPYISSVTISNSSILLGQPFEITVVGTNRGVTSDMQTLSISFPNMTDTSGIQILEENFSQHPTTIEKGQEIGSHYQGTQYPAYAQYPIVESYNRPWDAGASHEIRLAITPQSSGKFLVLVKSVVLPHSNTVHYPTSGVLDQQGEYARPYLVNVTKR
ncbi:MAG TPA: hypothetical protein VJ792_06765 [Candidatus Nitrosotalea sp.]|nr:hypothetical protein [Candidatus Nitrosotalea sp.]